MAARSATAERAEEPAAPPSAGTADRINWHRLDSASVLEHVGSSHDGLDQAEARGGWSRTA